MDRTWTILLAKGPVWMMTVTMVAVALLTDPMAVSL